MAEINKNNNNKKSATDHNILYPLINENIHFLRQGRFLIADLEPEIYSEVKDVAGKGTIGAHFRHCIDMYNCFFSGLNNSAVDYINRERDSYVEKNKEEAERKIVEHVYQLLDLRENPPSDHDIQIKFVTNSEDYGTIEHEIVSSLPRELFMLSSHTVHHYALIAHILISNDQECPEHFGVAPSTLSYRKKGRA